jgi:hypothetical protein
MSIDAPGQRVGALSVHAPSGQRWYRAPLNEGEFFDNLVRHTPRERRSFLELPGSPDLDFGPGAYPITVSSFRVLDQPGTATPTVWATIKLDDGDLLDLRFVFLDLDDHACQAAMGGPLDALRAEEAPFQDYLTSLGQLLARAGIDLRQSSFIDLRDRPEFDSLTAAELPQLLAAGPAGPALNIYFVRTIEPIGTAALIESTPGAPLDVGSGPGGVAIALDTLCYRPWTTLARITGHAIARHLGLARNREPGGELDTLADTDGSTGNLMFYSELGGSDLTVGQREVLSASPVLQ